MDDLWTPSGRTTPMAMLIVPAMCVLTVPVAALYSLANVYIPIAYIGIVLPPVLGAVLGSLGSAALSAAHNRNRVLALGTGAALGLVGLYQVWWFFSYFLLSRFDEPVGMMEAADPVLIVSLAEALYEEGWFTIGRGGGSTVSGMFLGAIWAAEALCIPGVAVYMTWDQANETPYDERAGAWAEPMGTLVVTDGSALQELTEAVRRAERGRLERALVPPGEDSNVFGLLDGHRIGDFATISVVELTITQGKDGPEEARKILLRHRVVRPEFFDAVAELGQAQAEATVGGSTEQGEASNDGASDIG